MTKINSDYIKANVTCVHCNSNNLKRNYKKSFKSPYNSEGDFIPETMEWRQFTCKSCDQHTNVLNNNDKIIEISEEPVLPLCAFNICFDENKDTNSSIWIFFKEDIVNSYEKGILHIPYDDLREYHILHFYKLMNSHDYHCDNLSENHFFLLPSNCMNNFRSYMFGDETLPQNYLDDIEKLFIKYAGNFSVESLY